MIVQQHPDFAWLLDYATGSMTLGFHTVIAGHLEVCAECRAQARSALNIGTKLVGNSEPTVAPRLSPAAIRNLDREPKIKLAPAPRPALNSLRDFVASRLQFDWAGLQWRQGVTGLKIAKLQENEQERVWLLHAKAGTPMPEHTHAGAELTLILHGAYRAADQEYRVGDVDENDEEVTHQPIVTADDECVSLLVFEGKLKYTGAMGIAQKILNF